MEDKLKSLILQLEYELEVIKKVEAEIKTKNEELLKTNSEKDKFFSIIAHDLSSPLHVLLGLTEMMANSTEIFTGQEMFEQSKHLYSSVSNLNRLIENLFEWAQMQRGARHLIHKNLLWTALFKEVLMRFIKVRHKKA